MSRSVQAFLVSLLVVLSTCTASGIDVQLKAMRPSDEARAGFPFDFVKLEKTTTPPEGGWKMPSLQCKTPVYAFLELGGEKRLLILDVANPSDKFYSRVYFDVNGNQDLTDDRIAGEEKRNEPFEYSPSFAFKAVPVKAGSAATPFNFRLYLSYRGPKSKIPSASSIKRSLTVFAAADTWYLGEFDHKDKHYRICLGDGSANGRFDDTPVAPDLTRLTPGTLVELEGDRVLLSAKKEMDYTQFQIFGDILVLDGETFKRTVDLSKGLLKLTPITGGSGTLELNMETERLCLYSEKGTGFISMFNPGKECALPPGTYRMASYRALRKDEQGDLWAITANALQETPAVTLAEGEKAALTFGEPYRTFSEVPDWSIKSVQRGRDQASIEFHIQGGAMEMVTDLVRLSGSKTRIPLSTVETNRPAEAAFKVLTDDGDLVAEGHFEYG